MADLKNYSLLILFNGLSVSKTIRSVNPYKISFHNYLINFMHLFMLNCIISSYEVTYR